MVLLPAGTWSTAWHSSKVLLPRAHSLLVGEASQPGSATKSWSPDMERGSNRRNSLPGSANQAATWRWKSWSEHLGKPSKPGSTHMGGEFTEESLEALHALQEAPLGTASSSNRWPMAPCGVPALPSRHPACLWASWRSPLGPSFCPTPHPQLLRLIQAINFLLGDHAIPTSVALLEGN